MTKPILFGHPISVFTRKAHLILLEKGIEHEYKVMPPQSDDPEFCAASPLGKIPAFKDEHACFADSSVIFHYLNKFYDGPTLLPEDPQGYTQALWYEEYADTVMVAVIGGHLFAEVVLAERLFNRAPNQADIDKAVNEELPVIYKFLEKRLDGREWLVGDALTLADIAVGSALVTLYHCGQQVPDSAPALQAYVQRLFALPSFKGVIDQEVQVMQAMEYASPLAA